MNRSARTARQHGMTLIELLISLAIGLVIMIAIGSAYLNTTQMTRQREDRTLLDEPARVALQLLRYNLSMAGYMDIFSLDANNIPQAGSLFVPGNVQRTNLYVRDPAVAAQAPIGQLFQGLTPVFGCDGAMASSPNAIANAVAGGAALPAFTCGTASTTRHTLQIVYQGVPRNANPTNSLLGADATTGDGLDCLQRAPVAGQLIINRFSAPAPAAGAISQFQCAGSGAAAAQSIAEGVEEFVLRYQVSAPGDIDNPVTAGGAQQRYLSATEVRTAATNAQGWAGVTAVEVCIVSATPRSAGAPAQGTTALQTTRPTCTRAANGAFNANVARAAGDDRLWKRHISLISVRNAVFATPL